MSRYEDQKALSQKVVEEAQWRKLAAINRELQRENTELREALLELMKRYDAFKDLSREARDDNKELREALANLSKRIRECSGALWFALADDVEAAEAALARHSRPAEPANSGDKN